VQSNILAIIPARGGSKRLPGKNIKELDGRPLIAYSVLAAQSTPSITHTILASDIEDGIKLATEYKVAWCRLIDENTQDESTLAGSLRQSTWAYQHVWSITFDWVVLLQPTCPLRQPSLLERWINQVLNTPDCDGGLTVDKGGFKLGACDSNGFFYPNYKPMTPKANAEEYIGRENGVWYMFKAENVLKGQPFGGRMIPIECPPEQSIANVDQQMDWDIMEFLYHHLHYDDLYNEIERRLNNENYTQGLQHTNHFSPLSR